MIARTAKGVLCTLTLAALAAGGDEPRQAPKAKVTLPRPVPFTQWKGPFFDRKHRTFFVLFTRAPEGRNHFRAFGVDLHDHKIAFHIDADGSSQVAQLRNRIDVELGRLAEQEGLGGKLRWAMQNDTGRIGPPPPPDPIGGDEWARRMVVLGDKVMRAESEAFAGH